MVYMVSVGAVERNFVAKGGTCNVRLVDVAAKAGVSATVVSAVLRNATTHIRVGAETAERIRKIAQQLNYRPNTAARVLKGQGSDVIGVLIGAESTSANYHRMFAIEQAAYQSGRRLMIGQFRDSAESTELYLRDFISRGINSLVCFHNPAPVFSKTAIGLLKQIPRVVFQTKSLYPAAFCVDVNRVEGVVMAVHHLVQTGRKRIGLVLNAADHADPLMRDRLEGFRKGHAQLGLPPSPDRIWMGSGVFPPTTSLVNQAVEQVVVAGKADAIIASNDIWAIELMKCLQRRGLRVPQDVGVIGFDNLDIAALFSPALTTIDQNDAAFAEATLAFLSQDRELTGTGAVSVVMPSLVVRESA